VSRGWQGIDGVQISAEGGVKGEAQDVVGSDSFGFLNMREWDIVSEHSTIKLGQPSEIHLTCRSYEKTYVLRCPGEADVEKLKDHGKIILTGSLYEDDKKIDQSTQ